MYRPRNIILCIGSSWIALELIFALYNYFKPKKKSRKKGVTSFRKSWLCQNSSARTDGDDTLKAANLSDLFNSCRKRILHFKNSLYLEPPNSVEFEDPLLEDRKPADLWNTVILFPDPDRKGPNSSTAKLLYYIENARVSLKIAMYLVSHPKFLNAVLKKYEEGLFVSVITDYDTVTAHNNLAVKKWGYEGIDVKIKNTGFLMHHKFVIIDDEAVITGSLNWTKQGTYNNQENALVTTNSRIVKVYMKEFDFLNAEFIPFEDALSFEVDLL